ncbi:unnamed protein product, partial [Prorocentrum cordatum]
MRIVWLVVLDACSRPGAGIDQNASPNATNVVFVWAFVRNPFLRRASMVRYCMEGHICDACAKDDCGRCSNQHCASMYPNVVSPDDESYVDYIGHTETLHDDLTEIFLEVQRRFRNATGKGIRWYNSTDMTSIQVNKATHSRITEKDTSLEAFARCPG